MTTKQPNPDNPSPGLAHPSAPDPARQVMVGCTFLLMGDGSLRMLPAPGSPRPPQLNDVYTLATLAQRDITIKMMGDMMMQSQLKLMQQAKEQVDAAAAEMQSRRKKKK